MRPAPLSNRLRCLVIRERFDKVKKGFAVIDHISHLRNSFTPEGSGRFPLSIFGKDISIRAFISEDHPPSQKPCQPYAPLSPKPRGAVADKITQANELKDQGNKAFQAKDYDTAIDLFTKAIELDPQNHVLFSNRSAAKAGKKQWAAALEDAEAVCSPLTRLLAMLWLTFEARCSALTSVLRGRKVMLGRVLPSMAQDNTTKLSLRTRRVFNRRTVLL